MFGPFDNIFSQRLMGSVAEMCLARKLDTIENHDFTEKNSGSTNLLLKNRKIDNHSL